MLVTPETFRMHISVLNKHFTMISLGEWIKRSRLGRPLPRKACAITFDDGWKDNYEYAFPILEELGIPFTIFAVSDMIGTTKQFWPNKISEIVKHYSYQELKNNVWLGGFLPNKTAFNSFPEGLAMLIDKLKSLSDDEIENQILSFPLIKNCSKHPALMSWNELIEISNSGLGEVGSHTCNHYRLTSSLNKKIMHDEINRSKQMLSDYLSKPVELFCYPNGDTSPAARRMVNASYLAAVTTKPGINIAGKDLYALKRIGVHEYSSNTPVKFGAKLANW